MGRKKVSQENTEQNPYIPDPNELESARQAFLKTSDGSKVDFSKFSDEKNKKTDEIAENLQNNEKIETNTTEIEEKEKIEAPQYSEIELAAMKHGWRPKEEFKGDKSKWRDAQTWVDRTDLFARIDRQNQYIQRMEEQQKELIGFIKSRYEQEANNEKETLKKLRIEAIKRGDVEEVEKIEEKINDLGKNANFSTKNRQEEKTIQQNEITPEQKSIVDDFVKQNNSWFNDNTDKNKQMVKEFIIREQILSKLNPEMSLQDRLEDAKKYVNNIYDIEENPIPSAEGKTRSVRSRSDELPDFSSLPSRTKQIIDYYVASYAQKIKNMRINAKPRGREYYIREMIKTKAIDKYGNLIDR